MIAKKLTNHSYLIRNQLNENMGLVFERDGTFIFTKDGEAYENLEAIAKKYFEILIIKSNDEKKVEPIEVLGYPVKHTIVFDIENEPYPTYTTKEGSKIRFAAGWWVIPFEGGWRAGLSPKITTLIEGSDGPYRDKFSANTKMNIISKRNK